MQRNLKRSSIMVDLHDYDIELIEEEILSKNPELLERVDQFRADNFQLQNEAGSENLFHVAEQLCRESAELRSNPEVNAFLDAELALCKMMQNICRELVEGIDVHMPNL